MPEFQIPQKPIRLVKMMLRKTENQVKVHDNVSTSFTVKRGLKQGAPLLTVLFNKM